MKQTLLAPFASKDKPPDKPDPHDDETVATPPKKGQSARKNERETTRKVIYITSEVRANDDMANFRFHHVELLQTIQTAFPEMTIYDNHENTINNLAWTKWSEASYYMAHFNIHQKPPPIKPFQTTSTSRPSKAIVVHRIKSSETMSNIRNNPQVTSILQKHKLFIRQHNWEPDEWDTVPLGVLLGINPFSYSTNDAMININTAMKKANVKSTITYQVFRNKTQITINDNRISTQAYMVEVKKA